MADHATKSALQACGVKGSLVLGIDEPGASGVSWRLFDQPFVVVGRAPDSDLVLQDPSLSQRHAYFQWIGGRLFCVDLQSRTGTHWGDEPGIWGWVEPDNGVRIGPFRIRPKDRVTDVSPVGQGQSSPFPVPVSRSFQQAGLEELTLELASLESGPITWKVNRALVLIGSSPSCKIRLLGGKVAAIHAAILRTTDGSFAIDLLGPGGIVVNGRRARCAKLQPGDELMIEGHKIRVQRSLDESRVSALTSQSIMRSAATSRPARELATTENADSLIGVMLHEFGLMQDQSAERLQSTLIAIVHYFVGLHQDQSALIREDLVRIQALTEELAALRLQVERQASAIDGPPAPRVVAGESRTSDRPALPLVKLTTVESRQASPGVAHPVSPPSVTGSSTTGTPDEGEFHSRMFDKLAKIQGERQGLWQKLMESLIGKGA
jgi:pSer/pThr/pTyr-binding forkhead associated (FHA) protein